MEKTRLKELMLEKSAAEKRRITYADVAKGSGLSESTVERYANDRFAEATYFVVKALARYFGVSDEYFMRLTDERHPEKQEDSPSGEVTALPAVV